MNKTLKDYISMARPDHWFKNIFVLPGVFFAAVMTQTPFEEFAFRLIIGLVSVCSIASANYVINEWVDADFDRHHPVKKNRPSVLGKIELQWVVLEYLLLVFFGLGLAYFVSTGFIGFSIILLLMGLLYNLRPFRSKDRIYLDVLSESLNNPIRMLLGWFIVTSILLPPASLIIGYWMAGAFLMAVKRFSEFRFIADAQKAGLYRLSFRYYTEENLLISIFLYGLFAAFFIGIFLIKYKIELLISIPFIMFLFAWYLRIGFKADSAAQNPQLLFKERKFFMYFILTGLLVVVLILVDMPALKWFLDKTLLQVK